MLTDVKDFPLFKSVDEAIEWLNEAVEQRWVESGIECECGNQMDFNGDKLICLTCGRWEYPGVLEQIAHKNAAQQANARELANGAETE